MNARQIKIFSAEGTDLSEVATELQREYEAWLNNDDPIVVSTQTTQQSIYQSGGFQFSPDWFSESLKRHFMTLTATYQPRAFLDEMKPESHPDDLPNEEDLAF